MSLPESAGEEGGVGSCGLGEISGGVKVSGGIESPVMEEGEGIGETENTII